MNFTANINEEILRQFGLAIELTGDDRDAIIECMMKTYISRSFARVANAYQGDVNNEGADLCFAKAIRKIPRWAEKSKLIPGKIIRAFLQLEAEQGYVTYSELMKRCSDEENHPGEYVATFANNFAQMKLDGEKTHGKVFQVDEDGVVTIWERVKSTVEENGEKFLHPGS